MRSVQAQSLGNYENIVGNIGDFSVPSDDVSQGGLLDLLNEGFGEGIFVPVSVCGSDPPQLASNNRRA